MIQKLRRLALNRQGLVNTEHFGKGLTGTRKAIEHLAYVQIDTLSVVERAHHHVLWSRVPGYKPAHLNQLIQKKQIFEHWFHAAAYLPMRDYRFALPHMNTIRQGENRYFGKVDKKRMKEIMSRVRSEGPIRARDLDKGKKVQGSWWNWGPGKRALDRLFMQGDLMVCERNGMEKVYDLAERCLPEGIDTRMPDINEYASWLFNTTLRAHGIVTLKQLLHLKTGRPIREAMQSVVEERIKKSDVVEKKLPDGSTVYFDYSDLNNKKAICNTVKILSPFDNAVIHRERLNSLFNFDFRIECYVPLKKRIYGYFCLPILYGDTFVGRVDCKANRKEGKLEVLSLHLEKKSRGSQFTAALNQELKAFAEFNGCSHVIINQN